MDALEIAEWECYMLRRVVVIVLGWWSGAHLAWLEGRRVPRALDMPNNCQVGCSCRTDGVGTCSDAG